jgi:hypothetical protein
VVEKEKSIQDVLPKVPQAMRSLRREYVINMPYPDPGLETALTVLLQVWVPSIFSQKLGYLALIAQSR